MIKDWYNTERVSQPGSVILNNWMAARRAGQIQAADTYPSSSGVKGSNLYNWLTDGIASAGVNVNERTAMCVGAAYACVGLIGGAIASLPLPVYRRTPDGRERIEHDLWWLLNEQPNVNWTAGAWLEFTMQSILLQGDGFSRIVRASTLSPNIASIEPWHPSRVQVRRVDGRNKYILTGDDASPIVVDQDDMLHFPGLGFDGLRSMTPLRYALKPAVGTALAADQYAGEFFANEARPDFLLTTDQTLKADQIKLMRDQWEERHKGMGNRHRPAVMHGGLKVETLTMTAEDAQLLATRKFQVEDIARIFGVPPHMIGHTEKASSWGTGVEQMSIGFVKYTLQRHLVKIEQELNRKLFRTARNFVEFATSGLERGDIKTRNESYRIALGRAGEPAWMTVNEVRKAENLPPIEGGDQINQGNANAPASKTAGQ